MTIPAATLQLEPRIADPDGFYEEVIASQRDLSDEQSDLLLAKLVLILANHIGDRQILRQALDLARSNTIGAPA